MKKFGSSTRHGSEMRPQVKKEKRAVCDAIRIASCSGMERYLSAAARNTGGYENREL